MKRHRSLRVIQQDERLLPQVQALKAEHPFWGYRRIWAYLHFIENLNVNKKRIFRLMQEPHLLVPPNLRLKAKRTSWWHTALAVAWYGGTSRDIEVVSGMEEQPCDYEPVRENSHFFA